MAEKKGEYLDMGIKIWDLSQKLFCPLGHKIEDLEAEGTLSLFISPPPPPNSLLVLQSQQSYFLEKCLLNDFWLFHKLKGSMY